MTRDTTREQACSTQTDEGMRRSRFLMRHAAKIRWLAAGLVLVSLVLLMRALPVEEWLAWLRVRIDGLGVWGPIVLAGVYGVATVLLVPGSVLTLAAGAMFGLVTGTIVASLGATTGAAMAFLIARHAARDAIAKRFEKSPKFRAVDRAIAEGGWKIVALLRLSPAIPFNLQNYLYGLTRIRFWPCVLTSWLAMLPGAFMYVYLGWIGGAGIEAASGGDAAGIGIWTLRGIGLLATVIVSIYITRLARRALREQTDLSADESSNSNENSDDASAPSSATDRAAAWRTLGWLTFALLLLAFSLWVVMKARATDDRSRETSGGGASVAVVVGTESSILVSARQSRNQKNVGDETEISGTEK